MTLDIKSSGFVICLNAIVVCLVFNSCEIERVDDTRTLHPFSGEELVVFSFIEAGTNIATLQAMHTLPIYNGETEAAVENLDVELVRNTERSIFIHDSAGIYSANIQPVANFDTFHIFVQSPNYGVFESTPVIMPLPIEFNGFDSLRIDDALIIKGFFSAPSDFLVSTSSKILRYAEGRLIFQSMNSDLIPVREAIIPESSDVNETEVYVVRPDFTVFDPVTRIPIDTIVLDSVRLVLYTWSKEIELFNSSIRGTNREFGDGSESINETSWTNLIGGHGVIGAFATDTLTIKLPR